MVGIGHLSWSNQHFGRFLSARARTTMSRETRAQIRWGYSASQPLRIDVDDQRRQKDQL
ncbi:hypothetical protein NLM33_08070 [Bradyrhizobium sp. CCGUVB1N3]|uniref:hypothetical protein n=1 Tax=Bradyrhizobium sp. CCGUVB1N3 TaxID=2949629 RepID=UPI0020B3592C|nr:hypothetical protein [Bradyrhizobium sp. CCGUVB1N3]MCP3470278.1 hypothetical protein [Bradyrhizobium sp. CCGUVB1N3]